jgi:hypothetical protein
MFSLYDLNHRDLLKPDLQWVSIRGEWGLAFFLKGERGSISVDLPMHLEETTYSESV